MGGAVLGRGGYILLITACDKRRAMRQLTITSVVFLSIIVPAPGQIRHREMDGNGPIVSPPATGHARRRASRWLRGHNRNRWDKTGSTRPLAAGPATTSSAATR